MDHRGRHPTKAAAQSILSPSLAAESASASLKPLKDHKFFVHVNRTRVDEKELEDTVERLGGKVDKFFTNEITCVLTDDRTVTRTTIPKSAFWAPLPSSSSSSRMCVATGDKTKLCDADHQNAASAGSIDRYGRLKTQAQSGSNSIVNKAKSLGIRVCHIKDFTTWMKSQNSVKRVPSSSSSSSALTKSRKSQHALGRKRMVHKLCGPIIKVEDAQSIYKPFYKELKTDPALLLEPYHTGSPYDDVEAIHAHLPVKKHRDNKNINKSTVPDASKCIKQSQVQPKNQYCECCREYFCDLPKHLNSDKHRDFVSQQHNFDCLKEFVGSFPDNGMSTLNMVNVTNASLPDSPPTDSPQSESVVIKMEPLEDAKISLDAHKPVLCSKSVTVESPLQLKLPLCAPLNVNVFPTPSPSSSPLQCANAMCKKDEVVNQPNDMTVTPHPPILKPAKPEILPIISELVQIHLSPNTPLPFPKTAALPSDPSFLPFPNSIIGPLSREELLMKQPNCSPTTAADVFLSSPIPIDDLPSPPSDTPGLLEWPDFIDTCETKVAHSLSSSTFAAGNTSLSHGLPSISHDFGGQEQDLFKCSAENMFSSDSSDNNMTCDIQNILDGVLFNLNDGNNKQAKEEAEILRREGYINNNATEVVAHLQPMKNHSNDDDDDAGGGGENMQTGSATCQVPSKEKEKDDSSCIVPPSFDETNENKDAFKVVQEQEEPQQPLMDEAMDMESVNCDVKLNPLNLLRPEPLPSNDAGDQLMPFMDTVQQTLPTEMQHPAMLYPELIAQEQSKLLSGDRTDVDSSLLVPTMPAVPIASNKAGEESYKEEPPCLLRQLPMCESETFDQANGFDIYAQQQLRENSAEQPPPLLEEIPLHHQPCSKDWSMANNQNGECRIWNESERNNEPPVLHKVAQWSPVSDNVDEGSMAAFHNSCNSNDADNYNTNTEIESNVSGERSSQNEDYCSRQQDKLCDPNDGDGNSDQVVMADQVSAAPSAQLDFQHCQDDNDADTAAAATPTAAEAAAMTVPPLEERTVAESSAEKEVLPSVSASGGGESVLDCGGAGKDNPSSSSSSTNYQWRVHRVQGMKIIIRRSLVKDSL